MILPSGDNSYILDAIRRLGNTMSLYAIQMTTRDIHFLRRRRQTRHPDLVRVFLVGSFRVLPEDDSLSPSFMTLTYRSWGSACHEITAAFGMK